MPTGPLWFYILVETEGVRCKGSEIKGRRDGKGGHHLGPVDGRIVAEVLVGIAATDHSAYLYQDAAWTPAREKDRSGFDPGLPPGEALTTVYALIHWTTGGEMSFL